MSARSDAPCARLRVVVPRMEDEAVTAGAATRPAGAAAAPSAASTSRTLPSSKPPLTPAIPQERTEAAEMRALRERVRALEQQLASAVTEAPGEGTSNRSRGKGGKALDELASAAVAAAATADSASGFLQVKSFQTCVAAQSEVSACVK